MKDARNNIQLKDYEKEPCVHCDKYKTYQGHDGCLDELDGVMNACCGHGDVRLAYVQFYDGVVINGEDAITIQTILKNNKNNISLEQRLAFLTKSVEFLSENKFEYFSNLKGNNL